MNCIDCGKRLAPREEYVTTFATEDEVKSGEMEDIPYYYCVPCYNEEYRSELHGGTR